MGAGKHAQQVKAGSDLALRGLILPKRLLLTVTTLSPDPDNWTLSNATDYGLRVHRHILFLRPLRQFGFHSETCK